MTYDSPQDAYNAAKADLDATLDAVRAFEWQDAIPGYNIVDALGKRNRVAPFDAEEARIVTAWDAALANNDHAQVVKVAGRMCNLAQSAAQTLQGVAHPPTYELAGAAVGDTPIHLSDDAPIGDLAPSANLSLNQEVADSAAALASKAGSALAIGTGAVAAIALLALGLYLLATTAAVRA